MTVMELPERADHSAPALLKQAHDAIAQRADVRDLPNGERSMARCVDAFNALHGTSLPEVQGWHFMMLLKLARATAGKTYVNAETRAPICELCPRQSDVDEEASTAAGWVQTWDGWLCPKCADALRDEPPNTRNQPDKPR